MKVKVILNPWSDRGRAIQLKDKITAWGEEYGGFSLVTTKKPGDAKLITQKALDDGFELIVAAGGDGTVHEVVNGMVRGGRGRGQLGVIPIGSGNDFAYALGISTNPETAVKQLFTGKPRLVDLARLEDDRGRFAIVDNGVGIGIDATVSIESRNITRIHGFAMYTLAALRTIAFYYRTPEMKVTVDDDTFTQNLLMVAIGVGPRAGGGFLLTPDANHQDNLLDICSVTPTNRLHMVLLLLKGMKGTHIHARPVTIRRSQSIHIKADEPLPVHIDGEIFAYFQDNVRELTITSLPQALSVIV